ncbi:MAG: hemerythrin domain-containing protein [Myxococcaceae bacterium]|nr:hemerythrin domain-containing protein [Myxococcaceae bacterium]
MTLLAHSTSTAEQSPGEKKDILQVLLEGHEELQSCTALAAQLGQLQDASPPALSSAASRLIHCFKLGMPAHIENEDRGLVPLLFTTSLSQDLIQLLWVMGRQHEELERLVDRLVPLWTALRDTPERYAELAGPLARTGRQLQALMEEHLSLEEQTLYPLARSRFSPARLMELAQELAHGRRPPS